MKRSETMLLLSLAAVAALRIFVPLHKPPAADLVAAVRPSASHASATAAPSPDLGPSVIDKRLPDDREIKDLFAPPGPPPSVMAAAAPAAPAAPPPPPPPPMAPPLPFTAIGDWTEDGVTVAFLASPRGTFLARAGSTLDQYHIDRVAPGSMSLTYLPLKQTQQLTWKSTR